MDIREYIASERTEIEDLYKAAFPDEDLVPLVNRLLDLHDSVLSLAAWKGKRLVGHVLFTLGAVESTDRIVALLGPLAVDPEVQRSGLGSALVREGLARASAGGAMRTLVLGDPAYYGRFGFTEETGILAPYAIPQEWKPAWQGLGDSRAPSTPAGRLVLPAPWMEEKYWLP